MPHSNTGIM